MNVFDSNIANIGKIVVVWLKSFTLDILICFSIKYFHGPPDEVLMFADFEVSCYHEELFVEILSRVSSEYEMRLLIQQVLLQDLFPTQWDMFILVIVTGVVPEIDPVILRERSGRSLSIW